jgi:hypothetical protein
MRTSSSSSRIRAALLAGLVGVAACAGSSETGGPAAPGAAAPEPASPKPETRRGQLAPPPASLTLGQFWPARICTRGPGVIVVATSCGCDSRMTCSVARRGGTLDLHVAASQDLCNDCGTFVATCAVPVDARPRGQGTKTFRVTLDGKRVLDALELPRSDLPAVERCYE